MDKFTVPSMEWLTPGDIHKRFKIFKQKCLLIFDGPLLHRPEGQKARLLLLWAGDKGLEIYNTATWDDEADQFNLGSIFEKLEAYTKPQSNQILARYQLRCLMHEVVLDKIKQELYSAPVLSYYDLTMILIQQQPPSCSALPARGRSLDKANRFQ